MTSGLQRYRSSGRTSIRFLPAVLAAAAVAIGLGWAYQALTGTGYVFLGLVLFCLFVLGVVAAVIAAGRLGKNRHRAVGAFAALVIGGCGLASAYHFDHRGMVDDAVEQARRQGLRNAEVREVERALTFAAFVDRRVEAGWTLGKRSPGEKGTLTGVFVWLAWGIEALAVLGIAVMGGVAFGPFCERCGRWMTVEGLRTRDGLDAATVDAIAAATSIDDVLHLPPESAAQRGPFGLGYSMHRCSTCASDAYLTVLKRQLAAGPRGPKLTTTPLHVQVVIPGERRSDVRERLR